MPSGSATRSSAVSSLGSALNTAVAATGPIAAGLIPLPVSATSDGSNSFILTAATRIVTAQGSGVTEVAGDLAAVLRPSTGFGFAVVQTGEVAPRNSVVLRLGTPDAKLGAEGYALTISENGVLLTANDAAGLFHGVQTIRQMLPASVESASPQPGPWRIPSGRIVDYPRYAYRGAMLDVTRHFFPVQTVERYIDELALYKVNMLHLHLSDDQGWRIAIDAWPDLAIRGGSTQVGGGKGGYYTKGDYIAIVQYAQAHFMTVVPEIDMPSHSNAALASYAELNCSGVAPPLYTGAKVGFSSLCVSKAVTYRFVDDVVGELAALTPGPYIHLGGDEAQATAASDYVTFVQKAQAIVEAHGKNLMGWAEIAKAKLAKGSVAQYWNTADHGVSARNAATQGVPVVMSPAAHAYLDQKYTPTTKLGLDWAGHIEARDAYAWDPDSVAGTPTGSILGVEAPLWSETLHNLADIEYMAWPRMAGIAEIGWSPKAARDWNTYRTRLAQQAGRWATLGINFYRSPQIDWAS